MAVNLGAILLVAGASVLFGLLYQCALGTVLAAGVIGGLGWTVALLLANLPHSTVLADLAGAVVVGGLAEVVAVLRKEPVSLLVVPAIIPFVPGFLAYQSMVAFIQGHFVLGLERGMGAAIVAGALAVGLALATAVIRPLLHR
jgi:uncharacterized membrane protein YjjB (DUF3815 family)